MTNYQKSQVRDHFNKWSIAYSLVTFCLVCVLAIGWEARQEQKIEELEKYHTPTQHFEDVA
jgi:SNF family Na+-dependent transporter